MENLLKKLKLHFTDTKFLLSVGTAFLFFFISLVVNFYAGSYAALKASNSITDIILSNTRVYDLDGIFIYGPIVFLFFLVAVLLYYPQKTPFVVKSIALFILIRSLFIILTHIGPFPTSAIIDSPVLLSKFTFGGDLFFSGHTGLPFLMALVFWNNKILRIIFIVSSIIMGVVVLLAHLHYSIDVLAAFFITYTIYHIAVLLFKKDYIIF